MLTPEQIEAETAAYKAHAGKWWTNIGLNGWLARAEIAAGEGEAVRRDLASDLEAKFCGDESARDVMDWVWSTVPVDIGEPRRGGQDDPS